MCWGEQHKLGGRSTHTVPIESGNPEGGRRPTAGDGPTVKPSERAGHDRSLAELNQGSWGCVGAMRLLRHRGRWKSEQQHLSWGWRGQRQAELVSAFAVASSRAVGGEAQGASSPTAEAAPGSSTFLLPFPGLWVSVPANSAAGTRGQHKFGAGQGRATLRPCTDPEGTPQPPAQPRADPSPSPGECTPRKAARPRGQRSSGALTPGRGCPARPPRPPPRRPRAPRPSSAGGGRLPRSSPAPCPA